MLEQLVAVAEAAKLRSHRDRGQFRRFAFREWIQRGAADDHLVVLEYEKTLDLAFQALAPAIDQGSVRFERLEQLQDAADVIDVGRTQALELVRGDHAAGAGMGEQFDQQRTVDLVCDQVRARDAAANRLDGVRQIKPRVVGEPLAFFEQFVGFVARQRGDRPAAVVLDRGIGEEHQLFRLQRPRRDHGNIFHLQVEHFAGGRVADIGDDHDIAAVEAGLDRRGIDLAHGARVLVIDAVDHAHRLGGDEIARHGVDRRAGHGRVGQALREQRVDVHAQYAHRLLDTLQCRRVGDAHAVGKARAGAALAQLRLDLRPRAVHQHQPDAGAVEQVDVVGEHRELALLDHITAEGDDQCLAAKRMEIRRRRAEPCDELCVGCGGHGERFYCNSAANMASRPGITYPPTSPVRPRGRPVARSRCAAPADRGAVR